MNRTVDAEPPTRSGRSLGIALAMVAAAVVGYLALGMPGMDHSTTRMPDMEHPAGSEVVDLSPRAFAERRSARAAFVVNVQIPPTTGIDGTDAAIPYDEIVADGRLPAAKDTPILLYCASGPRSQTASRSLIDAGYSDVSRLDGGIEAWRRAGLPLSNQP